MGAGFWVKGGSLLPPLSAPSLAGPHSGCLQPCCCHPADFFISLNGYVAHVLYLHRLPCARPFPSLLFFSLRFINISIFLLHSQPYIPAALHSSLGFGFLCFTSTQHLAEVVFNLHFSCPGTFIGLARVCFGLQPQQLLCPFLLTDNNSFFSTPPSILPLADAALVSFTE
jgi:hypothetical protein